MEYVPIVVWAVTFLLVGTLGLPIAALLFPRLPDRGAGVALPLALVVITTVAYWVGRVAFGWPALAAGLVVLGAAAVVAGRRFDAEPDWRIAGETAAVFLAAFLFLVAIRAVDPAVHPIGGEKFLDFGLLRSLLRAPRLPPEDIWFAREPVQYYYGGHLIAALLTILTGTPAKYAYNLALPGFYAMLVTAAFGVGGGLADARDVPRRAGGLAAAFFVGFASNLMTPVNLLVSLLPDSLVGAIAGGNLRGLATGIENFSYWTASRVIPSTINEFPLFAWLNGDMHAHMMSTPFLLLVAALLFSYFRAPAVERRRRLVLVVGCVPVVAGLLAYVNTWSFPTVGGLTVLALALSPADPTTLAPASVRERLRAALEDAATWLPGPAGRRLNAIVDGTAAASWVYAEGLRLATAGAVGAVVLALGVLWAAPFFLGPASGRGIGFLPDRSPLFGLLLVHGGFLAVSAAYLADRLSGRDRTRGPELALAVAATLVLTVAYGAPAIGLFVPLLVVAWVLLRQSDVNVEGGDDVNVEGGDDVNVEGGDDVGFEGGDDIGVEGSDDVGFEAVLLIAGVGLALLVEFVFVKEQAGPGRLNTVFKTYMQVWVLWGTAAGGMFGVLVWRHLLDPVHDTESSLSAVGRPVAAGAAVVLVVSTSLYGGMALGAHFGTAGDPTLDATRFVEHSHGDEAAAIDWLADREGTPTIVTSPSNGCRMYHWGPRDCDRNGQIDHYAGGSAPSSLTGLPTVAGWAHEIGYRSPEAYRRRVREVREIYQGPPERQRELLCRYRVEYVYYGPAERFRYREANFTQLDAVGSPHRFDAVEIYPVDLAALCGS